MLLAAILLAATPADLPPTTRAAADEWRDCHVRVLDTLAARSSEAADVLAEAVLGLCFAQQDVFETTLRKDGGLSPAAARAAIDRFTADRRRVLIGLAVSKRLRP